METSIKNLDDLIFKNRNKSYGAYKNRKNYKRYLFWALISGVSFFLIIVSVPLIASYLSGNMSTDKISVVIEDTLLKVNNKVEKIELPEPEKPKPQVRTFTIPKVTVEAGDETDLFSDMENAKNRKVTDTLSPGIKDIPPDKPEIVEIPKLETYIYVEEMPEFPGGDEGRLNYLKANIKYPEYAKAANITGTVHVSFVIDPAGKVVEVELLRGIGGGCDEEALRVVENMPLWTPGRQGGVEVRVKFSMPIAFRLE